MHPARRVGSESQQRPYAALFFALMALELNKNQRESSNVSEEPNYLNIPGG